MTQKLRQPEDRCRNCSAPLYQASFEPIVFEVDNITQKWTCHKCKKSYKVYFRYWNIYEQKH